MSLVDDNLIISFLSKSPRPPHLARMAGEAQPPFRKEGYRKLDR